MHQLITKYPNASTRLLEIFFPLLTWFIITLPIWLSPFHPAVVAYFILTFDVYFFYKSLTTTIYSTIAYIRIKKYSKENWLEKAKRLEFFPKIHHFVIINNYMETTDKIKKTLDCLKQQDFPAKRISIVLAMEEREGSQARTRAKILISEYSHFFDSISATFHPDLQGEVKGKASNSAWAAKYISKTLAKRKINKDFVTITSCDADSLFPEKYFSYLTFLFLTDNDRYYHFYWAPVLLYSNFWNISLPIRIQATISSIARLSTLIRTDNLIQISTYSLSVNMLEKIGYWDRDIIPEDWHIFLQAFFTLGEKVKTIPIYLTISRDAINAPTIFKAFKSRYEQEKRWAWGVTDLPYAVKKFFTSPHVAFFPKMFRTFNIIEQHMFWPTSFFIITLAALVPPVINPVFSRSALGYNLPRMAGFILTITTLFLLVLITIDAKSRPKKPDNYPIAKTPLLIFQWILLPVISFFFSSLPALEAHTRLLFGKRLEYKVTKKI